ncbi:MAG TPA: hypothetical protein VJ742_12790 [Nitrososphaera sp.]|nr:hypothetical protein [Nitrososphaera sp.]
MIPEENLYDVARKVTDEVLGEGTYAEVNKNNPNPGVQGAIIKAEGEVVFEGRKLIRAVRIELYDDGMTALKTDHPAMGRGIYVDTLDKLLEEVPEYLGAELPAAEEPLPYAERILRCPAEDCAWETSYQISPPPTWDIAQDARQSYEDHYSWSHVDAPDPLEHDETYEN